MVNIEVDLIFFLFCVIIAVFSLPFIIAWTIYKGYKNPEFWHRIGRRDWVYILMKTPLGKLVLIVKPVKDITQDGMIKLFGKRRYFIRDVDQEGRPSVVKAWKHNKPLYIMTWRNPYPLGWGNPELSEKYDPGTIHEILNNNIMIQLMRADFISGLMKASLALSCVACLIVSIVVFQVVGVSNAADHANCVISAYTNPSYQTNATLQQIAVGACH